MHDAAFEAAQRQAAATPVPNARGRPHRATVLLQNGDTRRWIGADELREHLLGPELGRFMELRLGFRAAGLPEATARATAARMLVVANPQLVGRILVA